MNKENWISVKGFESHYQISDIGNVKSIDRYIKHSHADISFLKSGFLLVQTVGKRGYKTCLLYKNGARTSFRVHRMVAEHFIPNPLNLPEVNHIDGDKTNNNVLNLEWSTSSDNQKHAYRLGLRKSLKGKKRNYHGKLF